jgi:hypothetical protein
MAQRRIQDYGTLVTASSLKSLSASFITSAVLEGNEFIVDAANRIRVNPGSAITHQGVIIIEDEPKYLNVTLGSSPQDYTVYYYHVDSMVSGGIPADLVITPGLLTAEVVEGVILGYVKYPGGAIPLSSSMFIQSKPVKIGVITPTVSNASWTIPIKNHGYMVTNSSGGTIAISDYWDSVNSKMWVRFQNTTLSTGTLTVTFPFKVADGAFYKMQVRMGADINATVSPLFIDSAGAITSLSVLPLTGSPAIALHTYDLPRGSTQTSNTLVFAQLQMSIAPAKEVKIQSIGLTEFNLPI